MVAFSALPLLVAAVVLVLTTSFLRILYILPSASWRRLHPSVKSSPQSHMLVVLGSGGHTAEMMSLLRDVDPRRYFHRTYIISSGDSFSSEKAYEIEKIIQSRCFRKEPSQPGVHDPETGSWSVMTVPRARKIHQPLYSTPFSSLSCLLGCFQVLHQVSHDSLSTPPGYPDVIITNGPATAVILILAAFILKFMAIAPAWKMKTIYVESWARVKSLSLSGKLLLRMGLCDKFLVQWEALANSISKPGTRNNVQWAGFLVE